MPVIFGDPLGPGRAQDGAQVHGLELNVGAPAINNRGSDAR